jgi:hypothetical protein
MATSGKPALLLAVALMATLAFACSQSSKPAPTQTATERSRPNAAAYQATLVAKETETQRETQRAIETFLEVTPFCMVDLPESWSRALEEGKIGLPASDYLYAFAVAADGSRVFGSLYSDEWSGVVAVDRDGTVTRIRAFDNPDRDSANGAFDGRWLVWGERPSEQYLALRDVHVWDSTTGEVMDLPDARDVRLAGPVLSQGKFAWSRSLGNLLQPYELHIYSLADRHDTVVSNGKQVFPIAFLGSKLLVSERETPDDTPHLAMVDAATGQSSPVPGLLAALAPGDNIVASASVIAWPSNNAVTVWRPGEPKAKQIFALDPYGGVPDIGIAGDLVEWGGLSGTVVADLKSGSVTLLTERGGFAYANGHSLVVGRALGPITKNGDERHRSLNHFETDVVDVTKLPPLPGCSS